MKANPVWDDGLQMMIPYVKLFPGMTARLDLSDPTAFQIYATNTLDILSYAPLVSSDPTKPLHRRDGPIVTTVDPTTGLLRIAAFGGVFKPGTTQGYTQPIYISDNNGQPSFAIDAKLDQKFSQYECPVLAIYDAKNKAVYHTFFGGISHYFFRQTPMQQKIYQYVTDQHRADSVPFIGDVTTIVQSADGSYTQYILPDPIPSVAIPQAISDSNFKDFPQYKVTQTNLLGSSVDFLPNSALFTNGQISDDGVIALNAF